MNNPTTLHGFEQFLRNGGRYVQPGETLRYEMWFQDGRFYLQSGPGAPQPFTTIGMAIVALLFATGQVEVPHA